MGAKEQRIRALRNVGATAKRRFTPGSHSQEVAENTEISASAGDWHPPLLADPYDWEAEVADLLSEFKPQVAAYIAWASSPAIGREPATQAELASLLGLRSDRTIRQWREKDERIDKVINERQAGPLWAYRRDIFEALVQSAATPDAMNHSDRKLALEMLGDYVPRNRQELANVTPAVPFTSDEYSQAAQQLKLWESEQEKEGGADGTAE